ncbi:hypothetical protein FGE12_11445 [Aggregicoccus sp. 17bor-14]|uniref:MopE-related protein n=1 Tax=Myxococcaceae TaxID=31 RepID=UPI00129C94C2|nr:MULTISPECIES: MopE-related protein [Myxococcaceae]MBF5042999.1 hypothetical protein [Simulacricoccus sp. 17bor-14]MRI88764.1 hypothetical protein [Aggregicoccus sp. 17bor-14]
MSRPLGALRVLLLAVPVLLIACSDTSEGVPQATGCASAADCAEPGALCLVGGVCCTPSPEACDGKDNDCDGQVDEGYGLQTDAQNCGACGHACAGGEACVAGACVVRREQACTGGADEDGDGLADCADPDCQGASCGEGCLCDAGAKHESACRNGQDDDGDGLKDCEDPDCPATHCGEQCGEAADCPGSGAVCVLPQGGGTPGTCCTPSAEVCDGEDNDCDGTPDNLPATSCYSGPQETLDVGVCKAGTSVCNGTATVCSGEVVPSAERCNQADDDCDGQVDEGFDLQTDVNNCGSCGHACAAGDHCSGGVCYAATETACFGGVDEDGNGLIDCADPVCNNQSCGAGCLCSAGAAHETQCSDGSDNDQDAKKDCLDPDCSGQSCGTGCVCAGTARKETNCADGADNDGDGKRDCADSDCTGQSCNGTGGHCQAAGTCN